MYSLQVRGSHFVESI